MADTPKQDRNLGLSRERSGGRFVTAYSPEVALEICEQIAEGRTLKEICSQKDKYPARQTFHRWVVAQPELARAYAAARELSAHALEEEALLLADELAGQLVPKEQIRAYEVAMNQYRWSAGKRNAAVFSDKAPAKIQVPIQINTTIDLGAGDARQGTQDHPNIYALEAEVVYESEGPERWDPKEEAYKGDKPLEPEKGKRKGPLLSPRGKRILTPGKLRGKPAAPKTETMEVPSDGIGDG